MTWGGEKNAMMKKRKYNLKGEICHLPTGKKRRLRAQKRGVAEQKQRKDPGIREGKVDHLGGDWEKKRLWGASGAEGNVPILYPEA